MALERRLHRDRLRVSVDPDTVAEILRDAGIDPVSKTDGLAQQENRTATAADDATESTQTSEGTTT